MRKVVNYLLIILLVLSTIPFNSYQVLAEETEEESLMSEVEIVLFAEDEAKEIELYENIPEKDTSSFIQIEDDTEAILLHDMDAESFEIADLEDEYLYIQYTIKEQDHEESEETIHEGYVHRSHVVLKADSDNYRKEREEVTDDKEGETEESIEDNQKDNSEKVEQDDKEDSSSNKPNKEKEKEEKSQSKKPAKSSVSLSLNDNEIKRGDRDKKVVQLKKDLAKLGFKVPGNGTNLYGIQTEKRVKEFQEYYSLDVTSTFNKQTEESIAQILSTPLQQGKRHKDTQQLKKDLAYLGMPVPGKGTTLYGKDTANTVKKFQKKYKLVQSGLAEEVTLAKIEELKTAPLSNGMRREDVKTLKKNLAKLGFKVPGNGTNLYGSQTAKKVKQFQKYYSLTQTGIVNDTTDKKIKELLSYPLQRGKRHKDTQQLKKDLAYLGMPVPGNGTTLYGKDTESIVKSFQKKYKLIQNGIADEVTLAKIEELKTAPLSNGMRREDVKTLKKNLAKLGFKVPGNGTNLYGSQTAKKVKEFQKYYGLTQTGTVNESTDKKIKELLSSPLQQGKRHKDTQQLKKDLKRLGFTVPGTGTTLYGKNTAKKVREFQKYYKLKVNGIADEPTLKKIKQIKNSPMQNGKRHNNTKKLKTDLAKIGYAVPGNGTTLFGSETEKQVKQFQKDYKLAVSGIAEEITLAKIAEVVKKGNTKPVNKTEYTNYKLTLNQALDMQMARPTIITDKYSNAPAYVSADYLDFKVTTKSRANVRTSPKTGNNIALKLKNGTKVKIVGKTTGSKISGSTSWFKITYKGLNYYLHSSMVDETKATASSNVNVRSNKNTNSHVFGVLKKGESVKIKSHGVWHSINYGTWRNPTRSDMRVYLDPSRNDKFQHLRLDSTVGVSAAELNKALKGKGVLAGKGQAFINGAKKHGINEAYLMSHAFLETGHGTSTLAKGVEVGENKSGKPVRVTSKNRKNLTAIKTTYNMFGIGAVDSDPLNGGAITAYKNGWFTPEKAIEGGAKWIGEGYIYNEHKQNTLYKMKWNPRMSEGYAWKQYATDIAWATKQVSQIKNIYNQLNNPSHHFDIAKYK